MVEIDTANGRIGYGPVRPADVPDLFGARFLDGAHHALRQGRVEAHEYLKKQQRLCCARLGVIDPLSPDDYRAHGGWQGLERALAMSPQDIVAAVTESDLRGRGGAAFPAGIKWQTARTTEAPKKYVVANADEGDSGTFADRMLMEGDPFALIEGMTIAALAVGADQGYIYLRCEYPDAHRTLNDAIRIAREHGYLGDDIRGSGRRFELEVRLGAGSYVCGEETAMLESLEGKRGQVRYKPPVPAVRGLFGMPTVVNNVVTFVSVPAILVHGGKWYRERGVGRSRGTIPLQLAGNIKRGGLIEVPFGVTLREVLYDYGGGSQSGRPLRAVQVGGPLGAYLPASQFDTLIDYEAFAAIGALLGHGGIVAFDDTVDMAAQARFAMDFCAIESCGKCTPCRIGSVRGSEVIARMASRRKDHGDEPLLRDLCNTMLNGSLCALGGMAPYPVLSALNHFPEDFAP